MDDDEVVHLLAGWGGVFIAMSVAVFAAINGFVLLGLLSMLLLGAAILVLVYAFCRWRVPEIVKLIKFVKSKGVVSSILSLGQ